MKKLLLLGSVVSPCPPLKYGGSERVVYYQAKQLARNGISIILIGAVGTVDNFFSQLAFEHETEIEKIRSFIEFVEIGGGTQVAATQDAIQIDPATIEASRKLRLEMVYLARVEQFMIERSSDYDLVLNNMRGAETLLLPLAAQLQKKLINVMHLNIFAEMASVFRTYKPSIITVSHSQQKDYPDLNYLKTIHNPICVSSFPFNNKPDTYALFIGSFGKNKNPLDAIHAAKKANIPIILAGKIADPDYFKHEIYSYIDNKTVIFKGELGFEDKVNLYKSARVFLFPVKWNEPFGLVMVEAMACGTPVIAYPHGGPKEIIQDGVNGFLVNNVEEMAEKITTIDTIDRMACRRHVEENYDDSVVGKIYLKAIKQML